MLKRCAVIFVSALALPSRGGDIRILQSKPRLKTKAKLVYVVCNLLAASNEQSQIHQLTTALKQQMLKEIRENQREKSINWHLANGSPGEIRTLVRGSKALYACPLHHRAFLSEFRVNFLIGGF